MKVNFQGCFGAIGVAFGLSCSVGFAEGVVKIDGSSTVYPITEGAAEDFQKETGTKVTVGISGTGGGFKKFTRGETDVQNASRPILESELKAAKVLSILSYRLLMMR